MFSQIIDDTTFKDVCLSTYDNQLISINQC